MAEERSLAVVDGVALLQRMGATTLTGWNFSPRERGSPRRSASHAIHGQIGLVGRMGPLGVDGSGRGVLAALLLAARPRLDARAALGIAAAAAAVADAEPRAHGPPRAR